MYKLIYLPLAKQDIQAIASYIADSLKAPKAALDLINALDKSIFLLGQFPYAHKVYRAIGPLECEYRLIPVKNYGVFYVVNEDEHLVEIHRVIYAKMDLDRIAK